jgi:hypothetical protein
MKKLVVIGKPHLHYFALALQKDGKFEVSHLHTDEVFDFVKGHSEDIAVIVTELWADHGKELDAKETDDGQLTGAVLIDKLLPLCPNATFFLIGGYTLTRYEGVPNVVPLQGALHISTTDLVEIVNKRKS